MKRSAIFEQEVRRVARDLFPNAGGYSPVIIDGRERDGVFNDGETINILEATRDPRKLKAKQDFDKSCELKKELIKQYPDHNFKIWFITENDPTADQKAEADSARTRARCPALAMSLNSFAQRLVDAPAYLSARMVYHFGSVRNLDPRANNKPPSEKDFINLDLIDLSDRKPISPFDLTNIFQEDAGFHLLLGDFGAGKSMTMRQMFYLLRDVFYQGQPTFPIFLNLRDHVGQDEPASALYDHGTRIGFPQPERLVRAWRSGFTHLFLDGFDEISRVPSSRLAFDGS